MQIFSISLNYTTAPSGLREQLAVPADAQEGLLFRLRQAGIEQSVYLSTCNRCELYGTGDYREAIRTLSAYCQADASRMTEYLLVYTDRKAVRHLMRTAAGLESMVYGEDEILRQAKEAYYSAKNAGYTGYECNVIFQAAFTAAKRIKTETRLSKTAVSVATLAASSARKFLAAHGLKYGNGRVLVVGGGGDTGGKVLKDLVSYHDCIVYATERRNRVRGKEVHTVSYAERYNYAAAADVIISATTSPHYTISAARLTAQDCPVKPRLFIDLAVPSDIDENVISIPQAAYLGIDDFERIAEENRRIKLEDREAAEQIAEECLDDTMKEIDFHESLPQIENGTFYNDPAFRRFLFRYKREATDAELEAFLRVLERMEDKQ